MFAKLLGNLAFLGTFTAGFMLSSMAMLLVRDEAALEPLAVRPAVPPARAARRSCSSPCSRSCSSRCRCSRGGLGDVLYFFVWLACLSFTTDARRARSRPGPRALRRLRRVRVRRVADDARDAGGQPLDRRKLRSGEAAVRLPRADPGPGVGASADWIAADSAAVAPRSRAARSIASIRPSCAAASIAVAEAGWRGSIPR